MSSIGRIFVSVADVKILNEITKQEIGSAVGLTDSGFNSEIQSNLVKGGYLNALIDDIKHSRELSINLVSAVFKPEYLAMQTGTLIETALKNVYKFDECKTAVNGDITLDEIPTQGYVHVVKPDGTAIDVTPTPSSKDIKVGVGVNGQCLCSYFYGLNNAESITIDTRQEPMTVSIMMNVHYRDTDGTTGIYQITVPRLKFNGTIDFSFTADGVSTTSLGGMALQYIGACGKSMYAEFIEIPDVKTNIIPDAIVAVPKAVSLAVGDTFVANIVAVMPAMYSNVILTNGGTLTFSSGTPAKATVGAGTGLITGVQAGSAVITATYTPVVGKTFTTTIDVTVA